MDKAAVNGSIEVTKKPEDLSKELAAARARFSEISSSLRREHGADSVEVRLADAVSASIQRLEAQLSGCVSAVIE